MVLIKSMETINSILGIIAWAVLILFIICIPIALIETASKKKTSSNIKPSYSSNSQIYGGYTPRPSSLKEQLVSTINQTNGIIERANEIRNSAYNSPLNVSYSNKNLLKSYVPQILYNLQRISTIIDRDQSLMMENISGPYGQSTNVISWMTWIQQWFDRYESFIKQIT